MITLYLQWFSTGTIHQLDFEWRTYNDIANVPLESKFDKTHRLVLLIRMSYIHPTSIVALKIVNLGSALIVLEMKIFIIRSNNLNIKSWSNE